MKAKRKYMHLMAYEDDDAIKIELRKRDFECILFQVSLKTFKQIKNEIEIELGDISLDEINLERIWNEVKIIKASLQDSK